MRLRLKADLLLLLVALTWGLAFVAQRLVGQQGGVYLFNGARYLLAAFVVLPFLPWRAPAALKRDWRRFGWMAVAGIILFAAAALQQEGLKSTTAANAAFLTSLYVVFVPIVLLVFMRERTGARLVAAVALAALGAFLLSGGGTYQAYGGDGLELAGAAFWGLHVVLLGKVASRYEPVSFSAGQLVVCGLLSMAIGLSKEELPVIGLDRFALAVAYTGLFSLGLGYTLQVWAQRHTPPTDAALILSLESVVAAIGGWLLLDESLTHVQVAGCALILSAVTLSQIRRPSRALGSELPAASGVEIDRGAG